MKNKNIYTLLFLLVIISCKNQKNNSPNNSTNDKTFLLADKVYADSILNRIKVAVNEEDYDFSEESEFDEKNKKVFISIYENLETFKIKSIDYSIIQENSNKLKSYKLYQLFLDNDNLLMTRLKSYHYKEEKEDLHLNEKIDTFYFKNDKIVYYKKNDDTSKVLIENKENNILEIRRKIDSLLK